MVFYLDKKPKRLLYYSEFFNTAKMDSTFYEECYSKMTKGLFFGMVKATTQDFEFKSRYLKESLIGKKLEINK
jgi:uncharacterized protein YecE (DUF72 family)